MRTSRVPDGPVQGRFACLRTLDSDASRTPCSAHRPLRRRVNHAIMRILKGFRIFFKKLPIFFIEALAVSCDSPYLALHRRGGDAWLGLGPGFWSEGLGIGSPGFLVWVWVWFLGRYHWQGRACCASVVCATRSFFPVGFRPTLFDMTGI